MKPMNKLDPKLVQLGGDLPWVWGVGGGKGDLTVNEDNMKNVAFASDKEYEKEYKRSRGPEVQS